MKFSSAVKWCFDSSDSNEEGVQRVVRNEKEKR